MPTSGSIRELVDFLAELRSRHIHFELACHRVEAIMVLIAVPGERWEVEFFADGHLEVEAFSQSSGVMGEELLEKLFRDFDKAEDGS